MFEKNRQRCSVLLICVFTIIFPSANQLHCIYLTMISKNAEYNFPPNSKETVFSRINPGIYIFQLPMLGGIKEAATIIRSRGLFDPHLPGHHCLDSGPGGQLILNPRQKSFDSPLGTAKMVVFECIWNISRWILELKNFQQHPFAYHCVLNQTKDVGPTHDMCHGLLSGP